MSSIVYIVFIMGCIVLLISGYFVRLDNHTIKTHCLTMERTAFVDSKEFNYKKCVEHER